MINDSIVLGTEDNSSFDKMQIALAIRNSTYEGGLCCILLENNVLKDCKSCNLKPICDGIETVAKGYLADTTKVVNSFSFQ